jgi:hypothetical protein
MMLRRVHVLAIAAACAASISGVAQKPTVDGVLQAAASYLVDYAQRLSVVVAEEECTQYDTRVASATRRFHSDFVIVGLADGELASFRDVYSIDSNPVRPRDAGRLLALMEKPPTASVQQEATDITNAALRYYVNPNLRGLDMPTLPLQYLRGPNQAKSAFTLDSVKTQDGAQVAVVKFKVTDAAGLLPVPAGATTSGRFWIDAGTGAVTQTELSISGSAFRFRAAAKYKRDAALGLWLPATLFQQVEISGSVVGGPSLGGVATTDMMSGARQSLEGRASYSKYRRLPGPTGASPAAHSPRG